MQAGHGADCVDSGCGSGIYGGILHGRQDPCAAPAAVLRAGTVTVDLFEDTPRELLATILKAVRSC